MLSESQVARIEQRLLDERRIVVRMLRDTRRDIGHTDAWDGGPTALPTHLAEQGNEAQRELMSIQTAERHSDLLGLIDRALIRLRENPRDYDVSVVSGERIPFERLEMVPWTRVLAQETGTRLLPGSGNGRPVNGYKARRASVARVID
jgi:RNA polymerase-binding transcription factor DksA